MNGQKKMIQNVERYRSNQVDTKVERSRKPTQELTCNLKGSKKLKATEVSRPQLVQKSQGPKNNDTVRA